MAWWDSSSFSNFASNALKNAQQHIDKVLDIKDIDDGEKKPAETQQPTIVPTITPSTSPKKDKADDGFWSAYLGPSDSLTGFTSAPSKSKTVSKPTARTPIAVSTSSEISLPSGSGSEHLELKASATSAFTVRSKRVESTLTKYHVNTETVSETGSDSLTMTSSVFSKASVEKAEDVSVEPQLVAILSEKQTLECIEATDTSSGEHDKITESSTKGAPLQLIEKPEKDEKIVENIIQDRNRIDEPMISLPIEQMVHFGDVSISGEAETEKQNLLGCDSKLQTEDLINQAGIEVKPVEWSLAMKADSYMLQSGEGSGWDGEDLDLDDLSDDKAEMELSELDTESSLQTKQVAEKEDTCVAAVEDSSGEEIVMEKLEEHMNEDISNVCFKESPLDVSNPQEANLQSKMDESSQSVEMIDASELCASDIDMSVQASAGIVEGLESSPPDNIASMVDSTSKNIVEDEMESPNDGTKPTDLPVSVVSCDNLDQTDVSTNKLSESCRTLTGDDFHSLQEEAEQEPECKSPVTPVSADSAQTGAIVERKEVKKVATLVSSSYVKTMLEEAMTESVKDTDSHSSSTSDKSSEMVRIESGMNSGHTSGDEIDTTTSSDIEIISTPTPNGEYRQERPFDLSPLRHALSRTMRRGSPPTHKRSDSSSSGHSTWSKNGDDLLSPDGGLHRDGEHTHENKRDEHRKGHSREVKQHLKETDGYEAAMGNPLATQTLLKKLAEMAEILEAREKKLVELSRENIDLHEAKAILKNQLQQSEEAREAELEDLNVVTAEFTERISEFETKLHITAQERDAMMRQLADAQIDIGNKASCSSGMERLLREKDQQVAELLDEGEKLSKQQLASNNIIKKLRSKEKDTDALIKTHKKKAEQQSEELSHLHMVLDAKEDLERRQIEAIGQQNIAVKKQEADLTMARVELEDMQEKVRGLQAALDNSYKEISELHKANAGAASETARAKLSVEMSAKVELQAAMEQQTLSHRQQIDSLLLQIEDLQLGMVRQEREQGRREDVLRQEISDVQQRLQEAEERNQDLTQSVTSATRPLLRQIKNLQTTYDAQSGSYEKVEMNLTERLNEAQKSLAEAVAKERAATERVMEMTSKLISLETQVSTLRQEKSRLQAQLEMEKTKVLMLEDTKNSDSAQLEVFKARSTTEISDLKKERVMLENQLEMEKMRVEAERKKVLMAHEQLRDKEIQLQRQGMTPSPRCSTPRTVTTDDNVMGDISLMSGSFTQEDILQKTLMIGSTNGSKSSLYDSLRHTGAATLVENLQSQLKMKEGEIVQLQNEIGELEGTREAMARELVNLSTANDVLQEQVLEFPDLKKAHMELDSRYNALLQMYGEKVEEADELSMDLQDIKDMYKAQIEELVKRVR